MKLTTKEKAGKNNREKALLLLSARKINKQFLKDAWPVLNICIKNGVLLFTFSGVPVSFPGFLMITLTSYRTHQMKIRNIEREHTHIHAHAYAHSCTHACICVCTCTMHTLDLIPRLQGKAEEGLDWVEVRIADHGGQLGKSS